MVNKIRVAILDDHQGIIDGYLYRLQSKENIEVVATANYGEELEPMLAERIVDVLLLDIEVPTAWDNPNPYPILHLIPKLLDQYPRLNILAISMYCQATLTKAVMDAGASGYILKDDNTSIKNMGEVIQTIYGGDVHFSNLIYQQLFKKLAQEPTLTQRQLQALSLCAAYPDETTAELANRMEVANSTFRNLLSRSYFNLGVRNRTSAIAEARRQNLITPVKELAV